MEKGVNVVGYYRFSSDKQREESIEAQQEAIMRFATANNYNIIKWYIDRAYSAKTDKRPAFQQMIADSDNKKFRFVIVHKQDRFARNNIMQLYIRSIYYKTKLRFFQQQNQIYLVMQE